jgi:hypothetical protein
MMRHANVIQNGEIIYNESASHHVATRMAIAFLARRHTQKPARPIIFLQKHDRTLCVESAAGAAARKWATRREGVRERAEPTGERAGQQAPSRWRTPKQKPWRVLCGATNNCARTEAARHLWRE